MGALHEGHLSLVRMAKKIADRVVVSIFVNPQQFAPHEDLKTYPRDLRDDLTMLAELETDLAYTPSEEEMYPQGFSTRVDVAGVSGPLCGVSRPHFFSGVATVVAKLLIQALPDVAIFGEKDFQQLRVIQRMVEDLDIPCEIMGAPIVREEDGLAMSSRNKYLSPAERQIAPLLNKTMLDLAGDIANERPLEDAMKNAHQRLEQAGFDIDYLELRDVDTLQPADIVDGTLNADVKLRLFAAAKLGETRLIDNIRVLERVG